MLDQGKQIDTLATEASAITNSPNNAGFGPVATPSATVGTLLLRNKVNAHVDVGTHKLPAKKSPESLMVAKISRRQNIMKQNEIEAQTLNAGRWTLCCFGQNWKRDIANSCVEIASST
jgi:hypothetical protein